jgi:hypothetical protein
MIIEVKPKLGFWKLSKLLSEQTAHGIYPNVYLPEKLYNDYINDSPTPGTLSIVSHEKKHIERQAEKGWFTWILMYGLSSKFRLNEELIAIEAEMACLKEHGIEMKIDKKAKSLSGWLYLKCIDFYSAKTILNNLWSSIEEK